MDYEYIAIVTCGRTGSTALQFAMNQSESVLVRGENLNVFRGFYQSFNAVSEAKRRFGQARLPPSEPWFGCDHWNPESFLSKQRAIAIGEVLLPSSSTKILGFKEIRYIEPEIDSFEELVEYLGYLNRLLPGIRFLVNRRRPENTCRSGWWPHEPDSLRRLENADRWFADLGSVLNDRLGRPAVATVQYEEWDSDPMNLQAAWKLLGLPWDEDQIRAAFSRRLLHCK